MTFVAVFDQGRADFAFKKCQTWVIRFLSMEWRRANDQQSKKYESQGRTEMMEFLHSSLELHKIIGVSGDGAHAGSKCGMKRARNLRSPSLACPQFKIDFVPQQIHPRSTAPWFSTSSPHCTLELSARWDGNATRRRCDLAYEQASSHIEKT
jgi:hypothetical protein